MSKLFAGARIRALRTENSLTQVEMAKRLGFSTSYLNQLENDHRPLTVTTLMRLTSVFNVSPEYFSGERAARTSAALQQALAEALGRRADPAELADFATRFPGLAQDVLTLSRLAGARRRPAGASAGTGTPGGASAGVGTANRGSTGDGISGGDTSDGGAVGDGMGGDGTGSDGKGGGIPAADRATGATVGGDVAAAGTAFTGTAPTGPGDVVIATAELASTAPHEFVRDFFHAHSNYFDDVDREAEALAERLPLQRSERAEALGELLSREHGITITRVPVSGGAEESFAPRREFDRESRTLRLRGDLTRTQMTFEMAMQLAFLRHARLLEDQLDPRMLPSRDAMELAHFGMAQYFAAAVVLPYRPFLREAEKLRYDIDLLKNRFGAGFETIAQRLSTLQRPGAAGVPLFLLRSDRAGNISKRQSSTTFHFSRHGGSCPLWVLHTAFDRPGTIVRQVSRMPDGHGHLWIARTVSHPNGGFGTEPTEYSIALGCDVEDARRLVYSDGLDLAPHRATPIGPGCSTCPRADCMQRAFPPVGASILVDQSVSPSVPYGHSGPGRSVRP